MTKLQACEAMLRRRGLTLNLQELNRRVEILRLALPSDANEELPPGAEEAFIQFLSKLYEYSLSKFALN